MSTDTPRDATDDLTVRPFERTDAGVVRDLFIRVNRGLAPPGMATAFEGYIETSLRDEIDRIAEYFRDHDGAFFVAERGSMICGMFGLETVAPDTIELRRMYVDPDCRGLGIGRHLLAAAETESRNLGGRCLILSTSELQEAALGIYRSSGFEEVREEVVNAASNKTLGGGLRRFHFRKLL